MGWVLIIVMVITILLMMGVSWTMKQRRIERVRKYTLKQKLMASTLKDPLEGNYYF